MIRSIIKTSLVDWDGKITTVLFFDKCNFICPFCQNWELILHPENFPRITWEEISAFLAKKEGWIDGIVLTGGEPLVDAGEVQDVCQKVKQMDLSVKLDTNGSSPVILKKLLEKNLIDYVAMDVKASLDEKYYTAAGKKINLDKIKNSINLLISQEIDYEFRTTCVPGIIDSSTIHAIGNSIEGAEKWALQAYVPDNAYKEEYRKKLETGYAQSMQGYYQIARKYVKNVIIRGKI